MAQFERAPQENLILLQDHILDKKILDLDDHEVEIVYDVKLAFQNDKLYAAEVDFSHYRALRRLGFRKLAKLLTNRNKEDRVSWLYVQPLPEQLGSFAGNIKLKVPKAGLSEIHPVDLADILEELEGGQRVALFNALDAEQASDTLEEVEPRVQRELIRAIEKERAALLINEMSPPKRPISSPSCLATKPARSSSCSTGTNPPRSSTSSTSTMSRFFSMDRPRSSGCRQRPRPRRCSTATASSRPARRS